MRLLRFVTCCAAAASRRGEAIEVPASAAAEETRSLVRSPTVPRRRKRGRLGGGGSPTEWKPSLCSISEDNVVVAAERTGDRTVGSERKRKAPARSVRSNGDDLGRSYSFPMAIPAFSPTPFMF